ncbi:MAG: hypothetical protein JWP27_1687 [Flaviaesturariibacter sp.]|nr:hypothetical protein [Flaviaesturariibacter sp.]
MQNFGNATGPPLIFVRTDGTGSNALLSTGCVALLYCTKSIQHAAR